MSDSKAMSEREAFEDFAARNSLPLQSHGGFYSNIRTRNAWIGWQARASLAASAGSVVDISDRPGCVMHMPTADEIDKLRDEARRVSRAGVEWMRIEERAEVLANLADLALAGLAASAGKAECAYALIGRQLISSGLYDRMTDADSDVEAAGLISELVSVVDPILSAKYERHNAAPTPTCTHPVCSAPGICVRTGKCQFEERDAAEGKIVNCTWNQDPDIESGVWDTSCGEGFVLFESGPKENGFHYCCYCGGELIETRDAAKGGGDAE
jgi:hypothetical protein